MDRTDITTAAREAGLAALAEQFPEEIATAIDLSWAQREALAAMLPDAP